MDANSGTTAVLGTGTWGITLACLLAGKGRSVRAWDHSAETVEALRSARCHPRLEHQTFPDGLTLETDLGATVRRAAEIVLVVPSHAVREVTKRALETGAVGGDAAFVIASKGIEEKTLALMTEAVAEELGAGAGERVAVLSGPSHAEEVSRQIPTAVVSAAETETLALRVQDLFLTDRFRVYTQADVLGVELAGALKNVIAIAAGACAGMGFGDNTLAALIARGLAEIARLGKRRGAHPETFAGLAGIGDLVVTAMSDHSRNRRFGRLLAEGHTTESAQEEVGMVVEGVRTARAAKALGEREGVPMPITEAVCAVVDGQMPVREAVDTLMGKDPKPEIYMTLDDLR